MKQHAIPQNVLDVEFKLFTKFTLKEFAYLALGLGIAGVMIYLMIGKNIDLIVGIPIAVVSSIAGIVLALVPINDQPADKFIQNYITAITSPTQRVWRNKKIGENVEKPNVKPSEDGTIIHKDVKEKKKKIIGASQDVLKEEIDDSDKDIFGDLDPVKEESIPQDIPVTTETEVVEEKVAVTQAPTNIIITNNNIQNYQFPAKGMENVPGNINIWLCDNSYKPIPDVISYLKDNSGKLLFANKTGKNGYFLTNKIWYPGHYVLEFEHPTYKFPRVEIILEDINIKLPIKINTL